MLNARKGQRGYALILVLLTITIIGIVTPVIVSSLINSSKQYQKTEVDIQLTKLADMGSVYLEQTVTKIIKEYELPNDLEQDQWMSNLKSYVGSKLNNKFNDSSLPQFNENGFQFLISSSSIAGDQITFLVTSSVDNGNSKKQFSDKLPFPEVNFNPMTENESP